MYFGLTVLLRSSVGPGSALFVHLQPKTHSNNFLLIQKFFKLMYKFGIYLSGFIPSVKIIKTSKTEMCIWKYFEIFKSVLWSYLSTICFSPFFITIDQLHFIRADEHTFAHSISKKKTILKMQPIILLKKRP